MDKELMTSVGYVKITNEIKDLKENQRPKIVIEIDIARSHGDLKENAEYHAAKEKQAFIGTKIAELSDLISRAEIIDPSTLEHNVVSFGSTVEILDLDSEKKFTYILVSSTESNIDKNLISYKSPLGSVLLGKALNDEVEVMMGDKEREFEILSISFKDIDFDS